MLAIFADATRAFFRRISHEGQPLEVCIAGPDRAHNEMRRLLALRMKQPIGKDGKPRALTEQEIERIPTPVPFASLLIQPFKYDARRFSPASVRGIDKDIKAGTAKTMRLPRPVTADVQLDLWCGSAGGNLISGHIETQLAMFFIAESAYLPINWTLEKWYKPPFNVLEHFKAFGPTRFRLIENGWTNTTDLENTGEGAKEVRATWTGTIETALPYRPEEARLVRAIRFAIYDNTTATTPIGEAVVGGKD
jgi:hypothetical protein